MDDLTHQPGSDEQQRKLGAGKQTDAKEVAPMPVASG
jgi:hypothetical protein